VPRSGRRPAGSGTRPAIAGAARRQFAALGYDRTSLRSVAAEAGVDAALVTYFFGTKQELLVSVVELPFDPDQVVPAVFADGPAAAGGHLARFVAHALDDAAVRDRLTGLVRAAASEPEAAALLRDLVQDRILARVVAELDAPDADLRAALIGSQLVGLVMARVVLAVEPLASLPTATVAAALAPTLQHYLTGPLA
jgi:AcrR family transcriptional regulator